MPDFARRDTTPELMDTEAVSFEDFNACLVQLAEINVLTLAYRPTLAFLDRLRRSGALPSGRPVVIADIGSGHGDMLRRIDAWAARHGIAVALKGVDMNPWSARSASQATAPGRPIEWITENLFDYAPDGGIDLVVSSLFTHHLKDAELVRFIAWMDKTARIGWFVNDLERHWLPYYALRIAFPLARRHRFIRHDGPVSVASAFRRQDWERLTARAGVDPAAVSIEKWLPFRISVTRLASVREAS